MLLRGPGETNGATERREVRDEAGGEKLLPAALLRFWRDLGQRAADDPSAVLQTEAEGETREEGPGGGADGRNALRSIHPTRLKRRAEENSSTHTFNHRKQQNLLLREPLLPPAGDTQQLPASHPLLFQNKSTAATFLSFRMKPDLHLYSPVNI